MLVLLQTLYWGVLKGTRGRGERGGVNEGKEGKVVVITVTVCSGGGLGEKEKISQGMRTRVMRSSSHCCTDGLQYVVHNGCLIRSIMTCRIN